LASCSLLAVFVADCFEPVQYTGTSCCVSYG
jgi:hypothetical protein